MNGSLFERMSVCAIALVMAMPVLRLDAADQRAEGGAPSQAEQIARLKARLETQEKELQAAMQAAQARAAAMNAFEQSPAFVALVQRWERSVGATDAAKNANAGGPELTKLEEAEDAAAREMYAAQDAAYHQVNADVEKAELLEVAVRRTRRSLEAATSGKPPKSSELEIRDPKSAVGQLREGLVGKAQARTKLCISRESTHANFAISKSVIGASRLVDVVFDDQSVPDAFSYVSEAAQVSVMLDWVALEAAGITKETKVQYVAGDVSVLDALAGLAKGTKNAKGEQPIRLWLEGGSVLVSTEAGLKVWQSRHAEAQRLLETHPEIAARRFPEVFFNDNSLEAALEYLGDTSKTKLDVDWAALSAAGVKRDTNVQLRGFNLRLIDVVSLLLQSVDSGNTIGVSIEGQQLKIGKRK